MILKRVLTIMASAALLAWPIFVDAKSLAENISPASVTSGETFVFWLKTCSLLAGGILGAANLIEFKKLSPKQLWILRMVTAMILAGIFFVITFMFDFRRDYVF